jgi:hypothetical protein
MRSVDALQIAGGLSFRRDATAAVPRLHEGTTQRLRGEPLFPAPNSDHLRRTSSKTALIIRTDDDAAVAVTLPFKRSISRNHPRDESGRLDGD